MTCRYKLGISVMSMMLLIIMGLTLIAPVSAEEMISPCLSVENDTRDLEKYHGRKILGIVLGSVGIGVMGLGGMYYNDYRTYKENIDNPAEEMGIGLISAGAALTGFGSWLYFHY